MEVATEGVLVGSGTIVLVAELIGLGVRRDDGHILEGDVVAERGLGAGLVGQEPAIELFLQHDVDESWVEVPQDIPLGAVGLL